MSGQTGVEMEALTAVSVACLTIYDMLKAADKAMTIDGIRLVEKTGGRSGTYRAARPRKALSHGRPLSVEEALRRILDARRADRSPSPSPSRPRTGARWPSRCAPC